MKKTSDNSKQPSSPPNGQTNVQTPGHGGDNTGGKAHTEGTQGNGAQKRQQEKT
jgi:hypothetical protein